MRDHLATQVLERETLMVEGHGVTIQPHVLPHYSKLSSGEQERIAGEEGIASRVLAQPSLERLRGYRLPVGEVPGDVDEEIGGLGDRPVRRESSLEIQILVDS